MSVLTAVPHCLDYCSFVLWGELSFLLCCAQIELHTEQKTHVVPCASSKYYILSRNCLLWFTLQVLQVVVCCVFCPEFVVISGGMVAPAGVYSAVPGAGSPFICAFSPPLLSGAFGENGRSGGRIGSYLARHLPVDFSLGPCPLNHGDRGEGAAFLTLPLLPHSQAPSGP